MPRQLGVPIMDDFDTVYPESDSSDDVLTVPPVTVKSPNVLNIKPVTISAQKPLVPPTAQIASLQGATAGSLPVITPDVYRGGSKPGSIRATPQQATSDYLNLLERQKQIAEAGGNNDVETGELLQGKLNEAGLEKQQQAQDYQTFLQDAKSRIDKNAQQAQQAYADFRKKIASSGGDPSEQFWGDKGMAARIVSGFAAFASGLGAGLQGRGGNPFLEHLNQLMQRNFEAHRKGVEDMYNAQVAAGHLTDNAENRNRFEQQAKLNYYELASAHLIPELEGIKANATGQAQRLLADKTIADLMGQGVGLKQQLAHSEAMAQAQAYAMQRQRMKEVREAYEKSLERHKDESPENARIQAFHDMETAGWNRSDLAALASGAGYGYDVGTGRFVTPEVSTGGGSEEPHLGPNGKLIIPTYDANGKRLTPEQQHSMEEEWSKRVVTDVDTGNPRLVKNEKSIPTYTEHAQAYPEAVRLTKELEAAWKAGDEGKYHEARNALIELAPKLYGYTRGPSGAQAGERAAEGSVYGATVAGQLPEHIPLPARLAPGVTRELGTSTETGRKLSAVGVGDSLIEGWKGHLEGIHKSILDNTFGGTTAQTVDPFAEVGGKAR